MAFEGGQKEQQQQQQQEAEQQQKEQRELPQEEPGGGLRVGSPAAGGDIGIRSGGDHRRGVAHGWQRCLDLKTGKIFYRDPFDWEDDDMSRNGKNPSLNLSGHRGSSSGIAGGSTSNNNNNRNRNRDNNNNNNRGGHNNVSTHRRSSSSSPSSPASPQSSCVSSETEQEEVEPSSMVLVGCPHCLMYVMLSEEDPRCPKCKSAVLLDFLNDPKNTAAAAARKSKKN